MNKEKLNMEFQSLDVDYLYHLGFSTSDNLEELLKGVSTVVISRSFANAEYLANLWAKAYYKISDVDFKCIPIGKTERYYIYKIGHALICSHGVGFPSMLIGLNEIVKLMFHAKIDNYEIIRYGSAGGLGLSAGDVIVSYETVNEELKPIWTNIEFGETVSYNSIGSNLLAINIIKANSEDSADIHKGTILSGGNFYASLGRMNGAVLPSYTASQRDEYYKKAYKIGVRGLDMESNCFIAFCANFDIPAASVLGIEFDKLKDSDNEPTQKNSSRISPTLRKVSEVVINYLLTKGCK